jgi:RNA polymerase sigma-70 factor (ECF subfamily)
MAVATLALGLGLGRLFVPTSVFVRGTITDGHSGKPIPNAELRILPRPPQSSEKGDPPDARANANGQFNLYVGWYESYRQLAILATGYGRLTTNLGPRGLGNREVRRDFSLLPAMNSLNPSNTSVPPVVIRTLPESGVTGVDPELKELRVTFSKPMREHSGSISKWGEAEFPEVAGEVKFLPDRRTWVLPIRLQPGKVYAVWINPEQDGGFQDLSGQSAVTYLLIFETRK